MFVSEFVWNSGTGQGELARKAGASQSIVTEVISLHFMSVENLRALRRTGTIIGV
jgi:hypothetical protein